MVSDIERSQHSYSVEINFGSIHWVKRAFYALTAFGNIAMAWPDRTNRLWNLTTG